MSWREGFWGAVHAHRPVEDVPVAGPAAVRDWWQRNCCPEPPLFFAQMARKRGLSLAEYAAWYWTDDPRWTAHHSEESGLAWLEVFLPGMVRVIAAAEDQGVEWPDLEVAD